jgi:hypothetical protein
MAGRLRTWVTRAAAVAALASGPAGPLGAVEGGGLPVDLELVLAVDVSGSMDAEEQRLQRAGYVAALTSPEVLAAIRTGIYGRVAIAYVEWAGPGAQALTVPWRVVEGGASAEALAAELAAAPLARYRGTSISAGLAFAASLFEGNGIEGLRRVIDVSGDGPNNMGPPVEPARDAAVDRGIVVNGLPIMLRPSPSGAGLEPYFADCVVGGPGSFVLPVDDPARLAEAIRQKLVLEIAGLPARPVPAAGAGERARPRTTDCMVGERMRRMWADP